MLAFCHTLRHAGMFSFWISRNLITILKPRLMGLKEDFTAAELQQLQGVDSNSWIMTGLEPREPADSRCVRRLVLLVSPAAFYNFIGTDVGVLVLLDM